MHANKTGSWYALGDLFKISDRHHSPSFLYGKSPRALGRMITVMSSPAISGKEDFTAHFDFDVTRKGASGKKAQMKLKMKVDMVLLTKPKKKTEKYANALHLKV